jgi:serine/threonine-protein kinase RsbW
MTEPIVHRTRRGPATPQTLETVHDDLESLWAEAGFVPEPDRMAFTLAVVEAVTNVIVHAVPVDGQSLELALELTATPSQLLAQVCEINAAPVPIDLDGSAAVDGLAESGRGLALIQALVSTVAVDHRDGTNVWTLRRDSTAHH